VYCAYPLYIDTVFRSRGTILISDSRFTDIIPPGIWIGIWSNPFESGTTGFGRPIKSMVYVDALVAHSGIRM